MMPWIFYSFWSRFRATSTPIQEKRFIDTISDYAAAVHKQVGHREKKKRCTISEYITLRRQTSAVKVQNLESSFWMHGLISDHCRHQLLLLSTASRLMCPTKHIVILSLKRYEKLRMILSHGSTLVDRES